MKVLVIDDEEGPRVFIKRAIEHLGHTCLEAPEGDSGLALLRDEHPDMVLMDIQMPGRSGLEVLKEIRAGYPDAIVVMMTGLGSEEFAVQALRLRANDYLQKPLRLRELTHLLHKYGALLEKTRLDEEVRALIRRREWEMVLPSELDMIGRTAEFLASEVRHRLSNDRRLGVQLGLHELLMNALEHGNLCITWDEKAQELESRGSIVDLINEKRRDPQLAKRRIHLQFFDTGDHLEWIIRDEGIGFDWTTLPNPTEGDHLMGSHGRGIFLARFQFDELEFLHNGNTVRARIYTTAFPDS